jgi:hypothetical protein
MKHLNRFGGHGQDHTATMAVCPTAHSLTLAKAILTSRTALMLLPNCSKRGDWTLARSLGGSMRSQCIGAF